LNEIQGTNETQPLTSYTPSGDRGKILVTGGTGFLGSYIIKHLVEKGYAVRALRRSNKLPFWIPKEIFDNT
jgi:dihydroflavonol-4-reductase